MEKLVEKEKELIKKPIIRFFEEKLSEGFKNNKGREIIEVQNIYAFVSVDEDESSFKEKIVITRTDVQANVRISLGVGTSTNSILSLRTNKGFILNYDNEAKGYYLENTDDISIIDVSPY